MNLPDSFRSYLEAQPKAASKLTIKNYVADINQFIRWYASNYNNPFHPSLLTPEVIEIYKAGLLSSGTSLSSVERKLSTLRKFSQFLIETHHISASPFQALKPVVPQDPWKLSEFKTGLELAKASDLTVKNYINDVKQFIEWAANHIYSSDDITSSVNSGLLEKYRETMIHASGLSEASVNRKLSSLRRYFLFAVERGVVKNNVFVSNVNPNQINQREMTTANEAESQTMPVAQSEVTLQQAEAITTQAPATPEAAKPARSYSKFPPLRLAQKLGILVTLGFDATVVAGAAVVLDKVHYLSWLASGKQIFVKGAKNGLGLGQRINDLGLKIKELNKFEPIHQSLFNEIATPLARNDKLSALRSPLSAKRISRFHPTHPSFATLPTYFKVWGHARHTRPNWYRKYHSYPVVHYFHFAALIIIMSAIGFGMYQSVVQNAQKNQTLAATPPNAPPRIMSFQGRLTDNNDNPISSAKDLRFSIYSDPTSSGSALLWQETQRVTPDQDGIFSVLLGSSTAIPSTVFTDQTGIYLGVTVQSDSELTPRQQIASVAFAENSETLQGLAPITAAGAGTTNVVLALDSSGNLTIGGSANPTFSATGGSFTLSGKTLNLNTTSGSNGNVTVTPDGSGLIILNKPIQNSTQNNNITTARGAVEIDDLFAVLATSSGQSAFTLDQNGTGPILSASVAGTAKFSIANSGVITANNYTTGVAQFDANGVLSSSALSLSGSLVSGQLPSAKGGTGADLSAATQGSIPYFSATGVMSALPPGTSGYVLTTQGAGANPIWTAASGLGTNYWQLNSNVLAPALLPNDLAVGGNATSSAVFQVFALANGSTPAGSATMSGNLTLNSAASIQTTKNQTLTIGGTTTGNVVINPTGSNNLGIGTTIPTSAVTIKGSSGVKLTIEGPNSGNATQGIQFSHTTGGNNAGYIGSITKPGGGAGSLVFSTTSDSSGERMRIDNGGNVGIGITIPTAKLDVAGDASISGNLGFTGANKSINIFNGSRLDFETSPGGDTGLTTRLTLSSNGNVGIGSTAPAFALEIPTGDFRTTNSVTRSLQRTLPTTVNDEVDIGDFTFTNGGGSLEISVVVPSGGYSQAKQYKLPVQYNQTNNVWVTAPAISSTGAYSGNDFDLDIRVNAAVASLRLRRTAGATAGTAYVTIKQEGIGTNTFTASSATSSVSAPGSYFTSSPLTQVGGNVGIGTVAPTYKFDVQGGSGIVGQFSGRVIGANAVNSNEFATLGQIAGGAGQYWQRAAGTLSPTNITDDVLIGGTANATASALIRLGGTTNANSFFNTGGNVGIGTTNPATARFQVAYSVASTAENLAHFTVPDDSTGYLTIKNATATDANFVPRIEGRSTSTNSSISLYANSASGTDAGTNPLFDIFGGINGAAATTRPIFRISNFTTPLLLIDASGNVGIGSTSPVAKLDVAGNANIQGYATASASLAVGYSSVTAGTGNGVFSGNVGIGTTNPAFRFQVVESSGTSTITSAVSRTSSTNLSSTSDFAFQANYTDSSTGTTTNTSRAAISSNYTKSGSGTHSSWNGYNVDVVTNLNAGSIGDFWGVANRTQLGGATVTGSLYDFVADSQYGTSGTAVSRVGFNVRNFNLGGTQTLTNQYGVLVNDLAGATNNYGITTQVSSGSNKYNIYASGTAQNYLAGNLGIGSTTPAYLLDVSGGAGIVGQFSGRVIGGNAVNSNEFVTLSQLTGGTGQYWQLNGSSLSPSNSTYDVLFGSTATSSAKFAILNQAGGTPVASAAGNFIVMPYTSGASQLGGNVGIGTTSTSNARLEVAGNIFLQGPSALPPTIRFGNGNNNTTAQITTEPNGGALYLDYNRFDSTSPFQIRSGSGATPRLTILSGGNVGIGSTVPQFFTTINGTTTGNAALGVIQNTGSADIFTASSGATTKFVINNNGNVGIGTANPNALLNVVNNNNSTSLWSRAGEIILRNTDATTNTWTGIQANGSNNIITSGISFTTVDQANNYGRIDFATRSSAGFNNNVMSILGGNVGIGSISPGARLDISGGIARENGYNLQTAGTDNMLLNGDFEQGTYGWTGLDTTVDTATVSGRFAAQRTGSSTVLSDDYIPVDPQRDVIQLEGWFRKLVDGTTGAGNIYFGYIAYDANKNAITSSPCGTYCYFAATNYALTVDGQWHKFNATTTGEGTTYPNFPVATKYIRVLVLINYGNTSNDAVTLMDHVSVKRLNYGPLFVGNNFSNSNMYDQTQLTKLYTTSGNNFIIDPGTGNVGIGSTAPSHQFVLSQAASTSKRSSYFGMTGGTAGTEYIVSQFDVAGSGAQSPAIALSSNNTIGLKLTSRSSFTDAFIDNNYSAATSLSFGLRGNEVARFTNGGNLGIGSTIPQFTTVINGTTTGNAALGVIQNTGSADIFTASAGATTRFVIRNNGNVGIGSASPAQLLDVSGGSGIVGQFSGRVIGGNAVNSNEFVTLAQVTGGTGQYWQRAAGTLSPTNITDDVLIGGTANATASALIRLAGTNNQDSFINTGTGNLGIGLTNPTYKLDVNGSVRVPSTGNYYVKDSGHGMTYDSGIDGIRLFGWSGITFGIQGGGYSEKMRLTSTGNLGIGSTSPNGKLDVNGAILLPGSTGNSMVRPTVGSTRITGEIAGYAAGVLGNDDGFLRLSAGGGSTASSKTYIDLSGYSTLADMDRNIVFGAGGSERMRIINNGNIGIGSTGPTALLDVAGNASTSGNFGFNGSNKSINIFNGSRFEIKNSPGGDTGLVSRLALTSNGNVGIGTITPLAKLTLTGGDTSTGSNNTPTLSFGYLNTNQYSSFIRTRHNSGTNVNNAIDFYTGDGTAAGVFPTNAIQTLTLNGGNVGIGTTTPPNLLYITGGNRGGNAAVIIDQTGANTSDIFTASASGTPRFVIQNGGNVGIGSTAPGYKLDVAGVARITSGQTAPSTGAGLELQYTDPGSGVTSGIIFTYDRGGSTAKPLILNHPGGNVGIGITNPSGKLDITAGTSAFGIRGNAAAFPANTMAYIAASATTAIPLQIDAFTGGGQSADIFRVSSSASTGDLFMIKNNGNIGIGSTAPQFDVTVNANTTGNAALGVIQNTSGADIFTASAGATPRFVITNGGNVGIGSASPAQLLDVSGGSGIVGQFSGRVIGGNAVNSNEFVTLAQVTGGTGQYWQRAAGTLSPTNITDDVLIGGTANATASALIRLAGTNNQDSFINTGTGNLGIGLTNPTYKLDVNGTFRSSSTSNAVFGNGTTGGVQLGDGTITKTSGGSFIANSGLQLSQNLVVNGTGNNYFAGNVGIGSTAPSTWLNINNSGKTANGRAVAIFDQYEAQDIFTASSAGTPRFVIQNNGNVGINDSIADQAFSVGGNAQFRTAADVSSAARGILLQPGVFNADQIIRAYNASGFGLQLETSNTAGVASGNTAIKLGTSGTSSVITFSTSPNSTATERMRLASNGNLGIGSTTPQFTLVVNGTTTGNAALGVIQNTGTGDIFTASSGATTRFVIQNGGNVGIGSAFPTASLNVLSNTAATPLAKFTAGTPPTVDMVAISNTGQAVTTAAVSALQINYTGGSAAVEASAQRIDLTPGGTSGGTWNGLRIVGNTAASGVTQNGIKLDNITGGAGTENGIYLGTGYDNSIFGAGALTITTGANNATVTLNNGSTGDVQFFSSSNKITSSGNFTIAGTTTFNGQTYTWPGSAGSNGYVLSTNGSGTLSWTNPASLGTNYWQLNSNVLSPGNSTYDLAIGGTATTSAKFQVLALTNGSITAGTASTSGDLTFNGASATQDINLLNGANLAFRTASTGKGDAGLATVMTLLNNGNLGIGSTTPTALLDTYGVGVFGGFNSSRTPLNTSTNASAVEVNIASNSLITLGDKGTGIANPAITLYRTTAGARTGTAARILLDSSNFSFKIQQGSNATAYGSETYTDRLNIDSSGNITITGALDPISSGTLSLGTNGTTSGLTLGRSGTTTTFNSTAWTATPTISGLVTASSGITSNGKVTVSAGGEDVLLNGATSNRINWTTTGVAAPTFSGYSAGVKQVLYDSNGAADAGYTIGIESSTLFQTVGTTANQFKWYGGTTLAGILSGTGNLGLAGVLQAGGTTTVAYNRLGTSATTHSGNISASNDLLVNGDLEIDGNIYLDGLLSCGAIQTDASGNTSCNNALAAGASYWQLNSNVLSPALSPYDLAIGGTATTSAKFQVLALTNGSITAGTASTSGDLTFNGTLATHDINLLNGANLAFRTATTGKGDAGLATAMTFTNTGNLGIGLTAPSGKLDITAGTSAFGIRGNAAAFPANTMAYIAASATTAIPLQIDAFTGGGQSADIFRVSSSASTGDLFMIKNNGNIGIGSTAPQFDVTVNANTTGNAALGVIQNTSGADIFTASAGATPRFVITNGGNVGIGVQRPGLLSGAVATLLDVEGAGSSGLSLRATSANGREYLFYTDTTNTLNFYDATAGSARMTLNGSGNFGIGTQTPIGLLHVRGATTTAQGAALVTIDQTSTADIFTASQAGATKFVINNAGNVGVGSTTPTSFKVEVGGNIGPDANGTRDLGSVARAWNNLYVNNIISTGTLNGFWQRASGVLAPANITDDLAIGGTATTSAKFQVLALTNGSITAGTASTSGDLTFNGTSATQNINLLKGANLAFRTATTGKGDAGLATVMTLTNGGNLGIGSTAPTSLLEIAGTGGVAGTNDKKLFSLYNTDTTATNNVTAMQFSANRTGNIQTPLASISAILTNNGATTYTGALTFATAGTAAVPTERMRIDSNGNLGVGTTTPASRLDIAGGILALDNGDFGAVRGIRFRNTTDTTTPNGAGFYEANNNIAYLQAGTGDFFRFRSSGGTDRISFDTANGNVGINASNPTAQLHIISATAATPLAKLAAGIAPTADMVQLTNSGFGVTTSGVNALAINYTVGSTNAVGWEAAAQRIDLTTGTVAGNTQTVSGLRIVGSTTGSSSITEYGIKLDNITAGTGNEYGLNIGTGWDRGISSASDAYLTKFVDFDGTNYFVDPAATNISAALNSFVGIGTTAPVGMLDIQISGTNTNMKSLATFNGDGNQTLFTASISGITKFLVDKTGNVGIGTTTPAGLFNLVGTTNQKALAQISGDGNQELFTASISGVTKFLVDKTGNVGIGSTAPGAQLDIMSTGTAPQVRLYRGSSAQSLLLGNYDANGSQIISYSNDTNAKSILINATTDAVNTTPSAGGTHIQLQTLGSTRMIVRQDGNVGIGTTTPVGQFQVNTNPTVAFYSNSSMDFNTTTSTSQSFTANVPAGLTDRLAVVTVVSNSSTVTATYGGVSMTEIQNGAEAANRQLHFFYLVNPPVGSSTVALTLGTSSGYAGAAHIFGNVNQSTPVSNSARDTSGTLSNNITCTAGTDLVFDTIGWTGGKHPNASGASINQEIASISASTTHNNVSSVAKCASSPTTMSWSGVSGTDTTQIAATINGVSSASSTSYAGLIVDSNGNVGIGTTAPTDRFQFVGSRFSLIGPDNAGNADPAITGFNIRPGGNVNGAGSWGATTATAAILESPVNYSMAFDLRNNGTSDAIAFRYSGQGDGIIDTVGMIMRGNGNVGVGTTAPAQQFHVYVPTTGSVVARFQNGTGNCDINPTTSSVGCTSDIRLKTNINSLTNNLDRVTALRGVSFNWKNQTDSVKHYGFIAQEVESIIPELVDTDANGMKTVNYLGFSPFLVGAVQELNGIVTANKAAYDQVAANLTIESPADLTISNNLGQYAVFKNGQQLNNNAGFAFAGIAKLLAGLTQTEDLIVNGTARFFGNIQAETINASSIAVNSLTFAGQSLHDYILSVVQSAGFTGSNVQSPVATINNLSTGVISPLAGDAKQTVNVNGNLHIQRTASSSGDLTVDGALTAQDASIAGTLRAGHIIADEIDGLNARIASIAANSITATGSSVTNIYNVVNIASDSGNLTSSQSGSMIASSLMTDSLYSGAADIASLSAHMASVPNLTAEIAQVNQGFMVLGSTSLSDTSVVGQLSVDGNLIIANNSINVLGADFAIQPLKQGNVTFEGGLIAIDTDGNLTVNGNANFAKDVTVGGKLTASLVSPVPAEDLVIQLPGDGTSSTKLAVDRPGIVVKNGSGSAVLKITDMGDVIASGAAVASEFQVVRSASADISSTQTIATASAGTAIVKLGQYERTIVSPFVTSKSLIYITPVTDTAGVTPFVARQTAEDKAHGIQGSFTIRIPVFQSKDVKVNWWIVN